MDIPVAEPASKMILERMYAEVYDRPIMGNVARGLFVEAMIAEALPNEWLWVGKDWASWDFEHRETWTTLEVKQSAALQPWSTPDALRPKPRFDIAKRSGYWYQAKEGRQIQWAKESCRSADIYIFAWHAVDKATVADHREPEQWAFYVLPSSKLPDDGRSATLKSIQSDAQECSWPTLAETVQSIAVGVFPRQRGK